MKPTGNQAVMGGGAGSALGVLVVVFLPKIFPDITFDANEASMLTAAFGVVFAWLIRYLPKPPRSGLLGVLLLGLFLGGCGLTPQGDFIRAAVKSQGAKAYDEGLVNAEWYICEGASVGSVKRKYGGAKAAAYNTLCDPGGQDIIR